MLIESYGDPEVFHLELSKDELIAIGMFSYMYEAQCDSEIPLYDILPGKIKKIISDDFRNNFFNNNQYFDFHNLNIEWRKNEP